MKLNQLIVKAGVLSILSASQLWAATISVNYTDDLNNSVTSTAGVVAAANWNNISSLSPTAPFIDDNAANTNLTVSLSGGNMDGWNTGGTQERRIYGDWIQLGSDARTLTLSNIPYSNYSLYLYHSHYASGEIVDYATGGVTKTLTSLSGSPADQNPVHQLDKTYVVFEGLTTASLAVTIDATTGDAGLAGFQIVQVPEPTILGLLAFAPVLAFRRRRA